MTTLSTVTTVSSQTPSTMVSKEKFPYKREFMNPDQLWANAIQLDLSVTKVILPNNRWNSLPRNIRWEFQGKNVAIIQSQDAYDKVNKLVDYFSENARMSAHRKGCPSPIEFYDRNYNKVVVKAQELIQKDQSKPFRFHLREAVYHMSRECTHFKISVTKAVFKYL